VGIGGAEGGEIGVDAGAVAEGTQQELALLPGILVLRDGGMAFAPEIVVGRRQQQRQREAAGDEGPLPEETEKLGDERVYGAGLLRRRVSSKIISSPVVLRWSVVMAMCENSGPTAGLRRRSFM